MEAAMGAEMEVIAGLLICILLPVLALGIAWLLGAFPE
jgi:hypothetical protein